MNTLEERLLAIEKSLSVRISFHDYMGALRSIVEPKRLMHTHPVCLKAKRGSSKKCFDFDRGKVCEAFAKEKKPIAKYCNAGVFEFALPLRFSNAIVAAMFFGVFRIDQLPKDTLIEDSKKKKSVETTSIPKLSEQKYESIFMMAIMAAEEVERRLSIVTTYKDERKKEIDNIIKQNFSNENFCLNELAKNLAIKKTRASQLVRKYFNTTFPRLLTKYRLNYACHLLTDTEFSIEFISEESGISEVAYFFRLFKKHFNTTPTAYREKEKRLLET